MLCIAYVLYLESIGQTRVQIKDNPFLLEKSVLSGKAQLGNKLYLLVKHLLEHFHGMKIASAPR